MKTQESTFKEEMNKINTAVDQFKGRISELEQIEKDLNAVIEK